LESVLTQRLLQRRKRKHDELFASRYGLNRDRPSTPVHPFEMAEGVGSMLTT
jgi:hypothetical protein